MFEFHEGTYEELYQSLGLMDEESRKRKIQFLPSNPNGDVPTPTMPVYAIGTVGELCDPKVGIRSCYDNENDLDDIVLLGDDNPFAEDGAFAYNLETSEPCYGKNERRFTANELNYLFSLDFTVTEDDDLLYSCDDYKLIVKIEDNEIILTVQNTGQDDFTSRHKIFYEFIYTVLSYLRG